MSSITDAIENFSKRIAKLEAAMTLANLPDSYTMMHLAYIDRGEVEIERGSNANGRFIKYQSGLLLMESTSDKGPPYCPEGEKLNFFNNIITARWKVDKHEPWKPSKPTLCWVSCRDSNLKETVAIIIRYDDTKQNKYIAFNDNEWVYATPLTRAEVMEYLDESEPTIERLCCNCIYDGCKAHEYPCIKCETHDYFKPAASSLEARPM